MAIQPISAAQYAQLITAAITSRNKNYNTAVGPIPDLIVRPLSKVLEDQNLQARRVQDLITLLVSGNYTSADLDNFVYNNGLIRSPGARASVSQVFYRVLPPTTDLVVRAGFPIGTLVDSSTNQAVTFVALQDTTMSAASAATYFNSATNRYELTVPMVATTRGTVGNVASGLIVRTLRPLNGFDGVTNVSAASGGQDPESNASLISRYLISLMGFSPAITHGIEKTVLDNYPEVSGIYVAYGSDPLLVRAASDAGAVDAYLLGSVPMPTSDTLTFLGVGNTIPLPKQPVVSVQSVTSGGTPFVAGTDYQFVSDPGNYSGSVKGADSIVFLAGGAAPAVGAPIVVSYTQDLLPSRITNEFNKRDRFAPGRDLLFRRANQVNIGLTGALTVLPGFSTTTVLAAVQATILSFVNALGLGAPIQIFDIEAVVARITGVDNLVITRLAKVGAVGAADINVLGNSYGRMASGDLTITLV
jgi:hypothetical protein